VLTLQLQLLKLGVEYVHIGYEVTVICALYIEFHSLLARTLLVH